MDLLIVQMREDIIAVLNDYSLPIEVKRLVVNEILQMVTEATKTALATQRENSVAETKENVDS